MTQDDLFPPPRRDARRLAFRHEFNTGPLEVRYVTGLRTVQAVVAALERLVKTLGSVAQAARHLDTSRPYLSMVLSGRKAPSRGLAVKLGYSPVVLYMRTRGALELGDAEAQNDGDGDSDGRDGSGDAQGRRVAPAPGAGPA